MRLKLKFKRRGPKGLGCEAIRDGGSADDGGDGAPPPPPPPSPPPLPQPRAPALLSPSPTVEVQGSVREEEEQRKKNEHYLEEYWTSVFEGSEEELEFSSLAYRETSRCQITPADSSDNGDDKGKSCKKAKDVIIPRRSYQGILPPGITLGDKEQLPRDLLADFGEENYIIRQKIKLLSEKYDFFRRTKRDGNCFYRGFIFSYLEHIVEIQDYLERMLEVDRLMKCVANSKIACESLGSLGRPEAYLSINFFAFEDVVHIIQDGLTTEGLDMMNMHEDISSPILPFLRLLTETEICTREDFYKQFLHIYDEPYASVFELCRHEVCPENSEVTELQIVALVNALGIPLILENLDTSLCDGVVKLNQHLFIPKPESKAGPVFGPLNSYESVSSEETSCMESVSSESTNHTAIGVPMQHLHLSSTSGPSANSSMEALELQSSFTGSTPSQGGSGEHAGERTIVDLSLPERRRLVTLLYRPGHYDILYPK